MFSFYSSDSSVLSRRVGSASTFYAFDPSGNVAHRLGGTGNVLGSYVFDAFGVRTGTDNRPALPVFAIVQPRAQAETMPSLGFLAVFFRFETFFDVLSIIPNAAVSAGGP